MCNTAVNNRNNGTGYNKGVPPGNIPGLVQGKRLNLCSSLPPLAACKLYIDPLNCRSVSSPSTDNSKGLEPLAWSQRMDAREEGMVPTLLLSDHRQ
ncbi:hypothetical protein JZ751_022852 [Albula glossodonta]|uniref:Uncharacterized protein n=1 Tax=Albula glossodonta TaxID=121402 RepID=A0A8T2PK77_9TELE|nr:hypothetical protein JZ751_022852 [Albula glossodonta]